MGPPPPVATSPSSQWSGEKTDHNTVPQKEGGEHRDTPPRSKVVLVPQTKSLIGLVNYYYFLVTTLFVFLKL